MQSKYGCGGHCLLIKLQLPEKATTLLLAPTFPQGQEIKAAPALQVAYRLLLCR